MFCIPCRKPDADVDLEVTTHTLIRMLGYVFAEMDEDWASRKWLGTESIALTAAPAKAALPMSSYDSTAEEHTRRIIDVVIADNPIEKRAV